MTKEQIGKEIKELIRSIKTHYTFVEEEDRIPLIELELITSKIRKLYEKSIINNYLHANDESYMSKERMHHRSGSVIFEKKPIIVAVKQIEVEEPIQPEPIVQQSIVENPTIIPDKPVEEEIQQKKPASLEMGPTLHKNLKDLKLLIGINDKFLLINNLFSRNDSQYKIAIEELSLIRSYSEAVDYMNVLAKQNSWNTESYSFVRLLQILEKRYK